MNSYRWRTVGKGNILHACKYSINLDMWVTMCHMIAYGKEREGYRLCKACEKAIAADKRHFIIQEDKHD